MTKILSSLQSKFLHILLRENTKAYRHCNIKWEQIIFGNKCALTFSIFCLTKTKTCLQLKFMVIKSKY